MIPDHGIEYFHIIILISKFPDNSHRQTVFWTRPATTKLDPGDIRIIPNIQN